MSAKPVRHPGELVFALVLVVFSVAALWQAYEISGFSGLTSAGVFPMLAAGTMVLAALCILVRTAAKARPDGASGPESLRFFREVLAPLHLTVIGLILLYLLAIPWLGFTVSSGLFLFACFALLWRRNLLVSLLLTAVSLGAIYVIFRVVFQVVLPQGTLLRGLF